MTKQFKLDDETHSIVKELSVLEGRTMAWIVKTAVLNYKESFGNEKPLPIARGAVKKKAQPGTAISVPSKFAEWYALYPLKKSKAAALKSWSRQKLDGIADDLIFKLSKQVELDKNYVHGSPYIPHPSTYLNGQRWEDDIEEAKDEVHRLAPTRQKRHKDVLTKMCIDAVAAAKERDGDAYEPPPF